MKIVVLGLWHLGCVTAACCARHYAVTGLDFDEELIANLGKGKPPIYEPGLEGLIASGVAAGRLRFTSDSEVACREADVLWVCYDTPVDENDQSDTHFVFERVRRALPHLRPGTLVLVSSQLPVGSCAQLAKEFPGLYFACSPENLRLGKAIEVFEKPDRVIVGVPDDLKSAQVRQLFSPFTANLILMKVESAETVKHALNAFLALSVTFINEVARICENVGADAREVAAGLKSDIRIGQRAYLGPGGPFAGGTLARDVVTLSRLGAEHGENLALIPAIKQSNDQHRGWALRRLEYKLGKLTGKIVAVLGLTYKPGTDTLRRSSAVELCHALNAAGVEVRAYDPLVRQMPADLESVTITPSAATALAGADAAVVCTEWPEFKEALTRDALLGMRRRLVLDANGFLARNVALLPEAEYLTVGQPA